MNSGKKATRSDVARSAGVAASTVSRVMAGSPLITPEVKKRVLGVAKDLSYVPSRQASLFAQRKTKTLGFVVPFYPRFTPFSRPYFAALLDGAVLAADEAGYAITIVLDRVDTEFHDYRTMVDNRTFDGLIFSVTKDDLQPFLELSARKIPFVLVNNSYEGLNSVDALPLPGMRSAFQHLTTAGHRRVGYIQGDLRFRNAQDRLQAFRTLVAEFQVEPLEVEGDFSRTSGYQGAARLLSRSPHPTVILTSSDRAAFGVTQYCVENGIRIPQDLSLVGYDNLSPAEEVHPALSTVDHPISLAGRRAVQLLTGILTNRIIPPVQEWLDTGFIARGTTGPPRSTD